MMAGLLLTSGCTSGSGDALQPIAGSGRLAGAGGDLGELYPDGPFGTQVGEVIQNYALPGYRNPVEARGAASRIEIALGAFYNSGDSDVFEEGSIFEAGEPKPKVLMINVAAVWCAPCKQEAAEILPEEYARFNPRGMELLMVLAQSDNPSIPAGWDHLDNWTAAFGVNYPAVLDPEAQLGALFDSSQFPANFLIDLRTMKIVEVVTGIPQQGFFDKLEALLAED